MVFIAEGRDAQLLMDLSTAHRGRTCVAVLRRFRNNWTKTMKQGPRNPLRSSEPNVRRGGGTIAVCRKVSQVAAGLEICGEDGRILEECWALWKVSSCENLLE